MSVILESFVNFLDNPYYEPLPWFMTSVGKLAHTKVINMIANKRARGPKCSKIVYEIM